MATIDIDSPIVARESKYKAVDAIALVLVIIGGLNWGLVGLFEFDLVSAIFGSMTIASRIVYVLVALAAIYCISLLFRQSTR